MRNCSVDGVTYPGFEEGMDLEIIQKNLQEEIVGTVENLTKLLQHLLKQFIEQSKAGFFDTVEQLMNYLLPRARPPTLIASFGELLVCILHGYSELDQCIYSCEKLIPNLLRSRLTGELVYFFEYMGRSYHSKMQNEQALKYFYKMLLAALRSGEHSKELHAYQHIAEEYYGMGDITKSRFFSEKAAQGLTEPETSTARASFDQLANRLLELYDEQEKTLQRQKSPPLSYYEDIPIEGGNRLLKMDEKRKEFLNRDIDFIRKNLPKKRRVMAQKFDEILLEVNDVLPKTGFRGKGNNIGEVKQYRSAAELDTLRLANLKPDSIQPDNNTVTFMLTHRSTNRYIGSFNLHHKQGSDETGFLFRHYQTYLTENGLLEIIKKFNCSGLAIEKMQRKIAEFHQFAKATLKPDLLSDDTVSRGPYGLLSGIGQPDKSLTSMKPSKQTSIS